MLRPLSQRLSAHNGPLQNLAPHLAGEIPVYGCLVVILGDLPEPIQIFKQFRGFRFAERLDEARCLPLPHLPCRPLAQIMERASQIAAQGVCSRIGAMHGVRQVKACLRRVGIRENCILSSRCYRFALLSLLAGKVRLKKPAATP